MSDKKDIFFTCSACRQDTELNNCHLLHIQSVNLNNLKNKNKEAIFCNSCYAAIESVLKI